MLTCMFDDIIGSYAYVHNTKLPFSIKQFPFYFHMLNFYCFCGYKLALCIGANMCCLSLYINMYIPVSIKLLYGIKAPFACTPNNSKGFNFQ